MPRFMYSPSSANDGLGGKFLYEFIKLVKATFDREEGSQAFDPLLEEDATLAARFPFLLYPFSVRASQGINYDPSLTDPPT